MAHHIANTWLPGAGDPFDSRNPATGDTVWQGNAATASEVDQAVTAARDALPNWSDTPLDQRTAYLHTFADLLEKNRDSLAEAISLDVGKPLWESSGEVDAMAGKVAITVEAFAERCKTTERDNNGVKTATRYKPHGVAAVFGPFNFPGHVPNGHIVPALLAGNTVVFKPSEKTPLVAQRTVEIWQQVGLPAGVINLVQGARDTGVALAAHDKIDAVLFTGGTAGGLALRRALADRPEVILALELGGNNPLVVHDVQDLDAAAYLTVLSGYLTAGQRCTCARRLIVAHGEAGDAFVERLTAWIKRVSVGVFDADPPPFMGPVIDDAAGRRVLDKQSQWQSRGGQSLVQCKPINGRDAMLTPGLIDVTNISDRADDEVFGPLLQLIRVDDFDAAVAEANNTSFGLVAALLSDRRDLFDRFYHDVRAGLINWNRQTTGASSASPFGGVGKSGNHRPAGYFSVDYCAYPVATLESETLTLPDKTLPGIVPT